MKNRSRFTATPHPLEQTPVPPVATHLQDNGILFLDFGQAAFGTLLVPHGSTPEGPLTVHLGEKLSDDGRIDRNPPGTVRYTRIEQQPEHGAETTRIIIPPDPRNTGPGAVKMPPDISEVYPFRYAEIEAGGNIDASAVRQIRVHYPFNDDASAFTSSDDVLNAVWELCKYSIKATTFCGVYVDGDRERIPYEGDAYINQLGHYGVDSEYGMARYSLEYLLRHPTWPTEWQLQTVFMAWADYRCTGDTGLLREFYPELCAKTLIGLARDDGLISAASEKCTRAFEEQLGFYGPGYIFGHGLKDVIDWPPGSFTEDGTGERDGFDLQPYNTVVNAIHCRSLELMSRIAGVLGNDADRERFGRQAAIVRDTLNRLFFDHERGAYTDGEGTDHTALHSSMFMLAFGLVPAERQQRVVDFVTSRGMACSVYGAQYLLEALYRHGADDAALALMTATHDRGWWHMIEAGSTITWEAWDHKYKNNLDWNHAWGAAPANIIPRFVLGVRPLEAGFTTALVEPHPGWLVHASGRVPTPLGPVEVAYRNAPGQPFELDVTVPPGMTARVGLPAPAGTDTRISMDGRDATAQRADGYQYVECVPAGTHSFILT